MDLITNDLEEVRSQLAAPEILQLSINELVKFPHSCNLPFVRQASDSFTAEDLCHSHHS